MKKLIGSLRNFYATAVLLCVMLTLSTAVIAQGPVSGPQKLPFTNLPYEKYTQMWRTDGTTWYYGTIALQAGSKTPTSSSTAGQQKDTSATGGTVKLTTTRITAGYVNTDTAIAEPIPGFGNINITASLLSTAGTTTVITRLNSSSDGFVWAPVLNASGTAYTFTSVITSSVTATVIKLSLPSSVLSNDRFYQWQFTGDGVTNYIAQGWYYWLASLWISR